MSTCIVKDCNTGPEEDFIFYKVPRSRILRRNWLNAISIDDELTSDSVVCGRHFNDDDFEVIKNGKKVLRTHAVPRLNDTNNARITEASVATVNGDTNIASIQNESDTSVQNNTEEVVRNAEINKETCLQDAEQVNGCIKVKKNVEHIRKECPSDEETCVESNQHTEVGLEITDLNKQDIEEIITHYHIKQDISKRKREINVNHDSLSGGRNTKDSSRDLPQNPYENRSQSFLDIIEAAESRKLNDVTAPNVLTALNLEPSKSPLVTDAKENNFIEVSVKDAATDNNRPGSPEDCFMLLENMQVELDPSNFLHDDDDYEEIEIDIDTESKKDEPISLLTSSDEDDVIIQEPHIDTVEVSDATDSDDMPLAKLVRKQKSRAKASNKVFPDCMIKYCCIECNFKTIDLAQYQRHIESHAILQVCDVCDYTTSSKAQFIRHKRKHREEKKFKCHLCGYKARHNMSLIYHLKTHDQNKGLYRCKKCGFSANVKSRVKKHMCFGGARYYCCIRCEYKTTRRSDLRRHVRRKHPDDADNEEVPP